MNTILNRTLVASAVLGSLLLVACASAPSPSAELLAAQAAVRKAESDPVVVAQAPLELKKASETLARANKLSADGEPLAEINSAAYVANRQALIATALAQAKSSDAAIAGAELERERARADMRTAEANRARAQASTAQAQAGVARQQTAAAEQRASGAEQRTAVAQASAVDAQQEAAQLQQRLNDLQATKTDRGMLVTLGDVLFETNQSNVKSGAQASLRKLADFLAQYPTRRVLIEGHTDSIGSATSNEALSRRRADAVDGALVAMGVSQQRLSAVGYGEDYPVADNGSNTNRALNRRVEVYIADNDQPVRTRR